jgi:Flp pilus assembly CpaF family ATPase
LLPGYKEKQVWIRRIASRLEPGAEPTDDELRRIIAAEVSVRTQGSHLTVQDKTNLIRHLFDAMRGLDILQPLLEEPSVTEIMVNSPSQIYIERNGSAENETSHEKRNDRQYSRFARLTSALVCDFALHIDLC